MTEPTVIRCTVRDGLDDQGFECFSLECRFSDGQKFGAIEVDGQFENLALLISELLNKHAETQRKTSQP